MGAEPTPEPLRERAVTAMVIAHRQSVLSSLSQRPTPNC